MKTKLFYVALSLFCYSATLNAGIFTNANIQVPMGVNQGVYYSSIAFGDIDNDGDLDLAITGCTNTGGTSQRRFIIYNNNNGTFVYNQEPIGVNNGVNFSAIAFGDIDNDGDLDLAVTGYTGSGGLFIIYKNNNGTFDYFQEPMGLNIGVYYSSIAFGDIDNDGDLDLAITGTTDGAENRLIIYKNNGGIFNKFYEPMGFNNGVWYSSIAFGDIDNDGNLDLIVTGDDGTYYRFIIYKNNGLSFVPVQEPMGDNKGVYNSSIAFGDIDNDGDLDLAVTGRESSPNRRLIIYKNNAGSFENSQEPMGANSGVEYSSIAFGDIDNDGDLDLAVTGYNGSSSQFIIFKNNFGTFVTNQKPMGANKGVEDSSIAFGDIDNDGKLDLAVTGNTNSSGTLGRRFIIYKNTGNIINTKPSVPTGLTKTSVRGFWRFSWDPAYDFQTPANLMRYKIAIGTSGPGIYNCSSPAIDYPRGQANLGNASFISDKPYFQSSISSSQAVYWKVCAIDTAFQVSFYSIEVTPYEQTLKDIVIGPNPYKANRDAGIIFDKLTADAVIEIYNYNGQLIEKLTEDNSDGRYVWKVPDRISSGMYIVKIKNAKKEEKVSKIMIIK